MAVAYVYYEDKPEWQSDAGLLTEDEAPRIPAARNRQSRITAQRSVHRPAISLVMAGSRDTLGLGVAPLMLGARAKPAVVWIGIGLCSGR